MTDPIQKVISALEVISERCEPHFDIDEHIPNDFIKIEHLAQEALSALKGMKAVDVDALRAEVHKGCPHGFYLTKCEVIDYLKANGYVIMKAGV